MPSFSQRMLKTSATLPPSRPSRAETRLLPRVLASLKHSTIKINWWQSSYPLALIEASGSSEAWYVPPRAFARAAFLRMGASRVNDCKAIGGSVGEKDCSGVGRVRNTNVLSIR